MKNHRFLAAGIVLCLCLAPVVVAGCSSFSITRSYYIAYGEVVQVNHNGFFYGIETDSGDRLYPVNLPIDFQQDGISVRVTYRFTERPTDQDWGTPIHIIDIRRS